MRYRILPAAAALAVGAVLTLTGCGSDSDEGSDTITGVPGTTAPTSAAAAPPDAAGRPKVTLPADLRLTFEGTADGDPKKDAVWADASARVRAMDEAIVKGTPDSPAVAFYSARNSQASAHTSVKWYLDHGYSLTGVFRYFDPEVTFTDSGATLTYCSDESQGFAKERGTDKVLTTPVTDDAYVLHVTALLKNADGVWQTTSVRTQRGAAQCGARR